MAVLAATSTIPARQKSRRCRAHSASLRERVADEMHVRPRVYVRVKYLGRQGRWQQQQREGSNPVGKETPPIKATWQARSVGRGKQKMGARRMECNSVHHFHGADAVEGQGVLVPIPQVSQPLYVQGVVVIHHRFEIWIPFLPIRLRNLQWRSHHRRDGRALRHEAKQMPEVARQLRKHHAKPMVKVVQLSMSKGAGPGRASQERIRLSKGKDGHQTGSSLQRHTHESLPVLENDAVFPWVRMQAFQRSAHGKEDGISRPPL